MYHSFSTRSMRALRNVLLVGATLSFSTVPAYADNITIVLFTGFSASTGSSSSEPAGLKILQQTLRANFVGVHSDVFGHSQAGAAFDFVNSHRSDTCCLVLIGHSLGGDTVIEFANDLLAAGIMVNLAITLDPVGVPLDDVLPANVMRGINYYQLRESLGGNQIQGAMNFNVGDLFPNANIGHTTIDQNAALHERIKNDVSDKCPEPTTMLLLGTGLAGVVIKTRKTLKSRKGGSRG